MLNGLAENSFINMAGWSLVHSLWQIPIIAALLFLAMTAMRRSTANLRYLVSVLALVFAFAAPILTVMLRGNSGDLRQQPGWLESGNQASQEGQHPIILADDWSVKGQQQIPTVNTSTVTAPFVQSVVKTMPDVLPWLVLLWMAGVLVYTIRLCRGWNSAQAIRRNGSSELTQEWQQRFENLITRFRLSRGIGFAESVMVEVPTVIGWFRPVILVPPAAFTGLSVMHLEAVLAHEIAHIKRHDYLVNLVQSVLEMLMFYHPAVWWMSGIIRLEREQACDDLAVSVTGDAVGYAYALIETERLREVSTPALVMAATGGSLGDRVRRLVKARQPDKRLNIVLLCTAALLVGCGVFVTASAVRFRSGDVSIKSPLPIHRAGEEKQSAGEADQKAGAAQGTMDSISHDVVEGENPEFRKVALDAIAGREGTVVIMDPRTGRVFTIVNQDLAVRSSWNPASTVKLITGMAAMDASLIDPDKVVRASARAKALDMTEALASSDNPYFKMLASKVGAKKFIEYAKQFGLGERTGIQLENESAGYLPEAGQVTDAVRFGAFGEGIEATPIQLATFVAALANGGNLLVPVRGAALNSGSENTSSIRRKVELQPASLQRIIAGMTNTVTHGTGTGAQQGSHVVAGKTGTCELNGRSSGLFVSYAPADQPRVVVVVGIRGHGANGSAAAKVAGTIYQAIGRLI